MLNSFASVGLMKRGGEFNTAAVLIALMLSVLMVLLSSASGLKLATSIAGSIRLMQMQEVDECHSLPIDATAGLGSPY